MTKYTTRIWLAWWVWDSLTNTRWMKIKALKEGFHEEVKGKHANASWGIYVKQPSWNLEDLEHGVLASSIGKWSENYTFLDILGIQGYIFMYLIIHISHTSDLETPLLWDMTFANHLMATLRITLSSLDIHMLIVRLDQKSWLSMTIMRGFPHT